MSALGPGAVHVWSAALDNEVLLETCRAVLSADEHARAGRFRFEHLARRYVIAHGFLRDVLARYLGIAAAAIEFAFSEHGKPFVPGSEIQFNLSHSGDLAVCAVTCGRRIGVDVECVRPVEQMTAIVARFFAQGEGEQIGAARDRERAFFECWTRKEAYIKGVGGGFSIPLTSFDTSLPVPGWTFAELPDIAGCVGTVAVEGNIRSLAILPWPGAHPHRTEPRP